jgi:multiple sugar transport system ATP-binding protein
MAKVTLTGIHKIYRGDKGRDVTAIRDLNIEIADREFVVFVGPSGCGKTTALRLVAGLEEASRGDISIGDRRVNDVPPKDRDIAMVFQNDALYPHLSVQANIAFGLKRRNVAKAEIEKRVREAAAILGLEELLDRKPKALSGGQRQRVALGRAIVCQPKVFLFDEPLSNLDPTLRAQMRTEIIKLHQRLQGTMVYVTHDQVEAMTMGTRIVVMDAVVNPETGMKEGVVQQIDTPLKLYNEPANLFVAGFFGSPAMNFLNGTLRKDGTQLVFKESKGGSVALNLGVRPHADAYAGKEVILGVRPEHCALVAPPSGNAFPALVDIVEPMGAETFLHLQTGAHLIISRSHGLVDQRDAGHRVHCEIAAERTLLFDPATSARLH